MQGVYFPIIKNKDKQVSLSFQNVFTNKRQFERHEILKAILGWRHYNCLIFWVNGELLGILDSSMNISCLINNKRYQRITHIWWIIGRSLAASYSIKAKFHQKSCLPHDTTHSIIWGLANMDSVRAKSSHPRITMSLRYMVFQPQLNSFSNFLLGEALKGSNEHSGLILYWKIKIINA